MLHAVIMAGGAGTRFWPASRVDRPKQLLDLAGSATMIQATVQRLGDLVPGERVLVVTNRRLVDAIRGQLPDLPPAAVLGEPCKRDTAPCVGLAASLIANQDPDATMVVMPADHVITQTQAFREALQRAVGLVEEDPARLVTFGIPASYPAETFGYIERGQPLGGVPGAYLVQQFHEKPSADVARGYLEAGNCYWNGGIFVWKARTILDALRAHEPQMAAHLDRIAQAADSPRFQQVLEAEFEAIAGKSIDYAVMEHYQPIVVLEATFDWDDVGNWQSLARMRGADQNGNTVIGKHLGLDSRNCIVRTDGHLVVTLGLEDCIVVHTPDATLVANRHREESIRQVVELLKESGWDEYL